MGVFEYACPSCGTPQKVRAPNGSEIIPQPCAACTEAQQKEKSEPKEKEPAARARR